MVVGNTQSKLSSAPSRLDCSLEHPNIYSARGHLGVTDEDIPVHVHFPVELQEEFQKAHKSPFHVWYRIDEAWSRRACNRAHEHHSEDGLPDANSSEGPSFFDRPSPTSPINIPSHNKTGTRQRPLTKRESLLQEAWERKQELYLKQELANLKERADVRRLGRSASDCGNSMKGICYQAKLELLERSMSDCSKSKKEPLITPSRLRRTCTRSLTDDDFEELKGCLDLGFRFDKSSIPELCNTLPALEVVCAVNQNFQESLTVSPVQSPTLSPTPSWRIASPGDDPEAVRERLRLWAQAVACSARLCY